MASQIKWQEPNNFALQGVGQKYKDVYISYSTSSITGKPIFNYKDSKSAHEFTGGDIHSQKMEIGTAVTVTLEKMGTNLKSTILTLLIPAINPDGPSIRLKALAIKTSSQLPGNVITAKGPGKELGKGILQSYEVITLQGKASFVLF